VLAQEAASQLGLTRVLLVPTGRAPHKEIVDDPGHLMRLELTSLAAAGNRILEADSIEVDAINGPEPSYTVNTLEQLRRRRRGHEWFLIMGADVATGFAAWHEPQKILALARLAIAARPGTVLDDAEAVLDRLGASDHTEVIKMPEIGVSSTRIRRRVAQGRPIRYLVPDAVLELIEAQELYAR
jgi:nicotinate-nucleotide adenylyltransferase